VLVHSRFSLGNFRSVFTKRRQLPSYDNDVEVTVCDVLPDPRSEVRGFLLTRFPKDLLSDDQDLFELGLVSSLFAMELVVFVEERFAVHVPADELRQDNFRSVNAIVDLIERLNAVQASEPRAGRAASDTGARA
jgi:methoxymalonate biosynthesis acyl carrier protein